MGSRAELVGAYRLLNNPRVTLAGLLGPTYAATRRGMAQAAGAGAGVVLLVHDTTEVDYSAHRATTGLGPIGNQRGRGLLLHTTLAVLPDTRQVLGVAHAQVVLRVPHAKRRKDGQRSAEAKLWETAAHELGGPPDGAAEGRVLWVHVTDRGSDAFEYMSQVRAQGARCHFVLRAKANRLLRRADPAAGVPADVWLLDWARQLPARPGSAYAVAVPATPHQPARTAQVVLAGAALTLPAPVNPMPDVRATQPLTLWVVRAWEPDAPAGAEPVEWVLLTSLPVEALADAQRLVAWYTCRWLSEDFHQALKTGCRVEAAQLDDGADLTRLLGFAVPIAARLLQLRQLARHAPDQPAMSALDPLLVHLVAHERGVAAAGLTLAQFWRQVAMLGGFQGRTRDGAPGWRTLWRGWRRVADLYAGARLARELNECSV